MLESRPSYSLGTAFGFALIAGLILLDLGLLLLLFTQPVTVLTFLWGALLLLSIPAIAFVFYWVSALSSARYQVLGNELLIEWGRMRQVIPLARIRNLVPGRTLTEVKAFRGIRWPGCFVGWGQVSGVRNDVDYETVFYATGPLAQQLLLITESVAYAISPVDLENFIDCVEALQVSGLTTSSESPSSSLTFLNWRIWRDRRAQSMLATAVSLNGLLFAYLCTAYGRLPASVPLHFSQTGAVDRVGTPANLFLLPLIGLLSWLINSVLGWFFYQLRHEPPLALVLWGAAIVVQIATWTAVLGLLFR